ncbi:hypothetical protein ISN45_Aa01g016910 [Arabidopsis thaliana x Arabidopsis arenosa]|nr:hypothetical protein ISN45_Aa01g016910 [Arabidopsis thaliana x Arabidopsis arenosa]
MGDTFNNSHYITDSRLGEIFQFIQFTLGNLSKGFKSIILLPWMLLFPIEREPSNELQSYSLRVVLLLKPKPA